LWLFNRELRRVGLPSSTLDALTVAHLASVVAVAAGAVLLLEAGGRSH
jgi:hypothetical protein